MRDFVASKQVFSDLVSAASVARRARPHILVKLLLVVVVGGWRWLWLLAAAVWLRLLAAARWLLAGGVRQSPSGRRVHASSAVQERTTHLKVAGGWWLSGC
jgi:hypothetical protein